MKTLVLKKTFLIVGMLALFALLGFAWEADAQNANCDVTNVTFRYNPSVVANPNGDDNSDGQSNFQEEYFIDYNHPYFYIDVQTTGCYDTDNADDFGLNLYIDNGSLNPNFYFFDGQPNNTHFFDIPSQDSITLVFLAGERGCVESPFTDNPECIFKVKTSDGNSQDDAWLTSLEYNCDGACEISQNHEFLGFRSYGNTHPSDQVGVTPPGQNSGATITSEDYLAPLPGLSDPDLPPGLKGFLQGLFQLLIIIAGILAIIMIVMGAITYLSTDAIGGKQDGISMMTNAVLGLVLALGAWIIINTINPNLAENLNITIPRLHIDGPTEEWNEGNAVSGVNICKGRKLNGQDVTQGSPWPDDANQRGLLNQAGITIQSSQNSNCAGPTGAGTPGCTSVYYEGAATSVIQKMIQIKNACPNCVIVVTGGSECWLHKSHGPAKPIIDLKNTPSLNQFINGFYQNGAAGSAFPTDRKITIPNIGRFWAEPGGSGGAAHWHVDKL